MAFGAVFRCGNSQNRGTSSSSNLSLFFFLDHIYNLVFRLATIIVTSDFKVDNRKCILFCWVDNDDVADFKYGSGVGGGANRKRWELICRMAPNMRPSG